MAASLHERTSAASFTLNNFSMRRRSSSALAVFSFIGIESSDDAGALPPHPRTRLLETRASLRDDSTPPGRPLVEPSLIPQVWPWHPRRSRVRETPWKTLSGLSKSPSPLNALCVLLLHEERGTFCAVRSTVTPFCAEFDGGASRNFKQLHFPSFLFAQKDTKARSGC